MAKEPKKTKHAVPDVPALLDSARRRLESDGALKLSVLGPKTVQAELVTALTAQGFEATKSWIRRPLRAQLTAALSHGRFIPLKSIASYVMGSAAPEAKRVALELVASGGAKLVLRGTEQVIVPPETSVLSRDQLAHFVEVAKVAAKVAKSKHGESLLSKDLAEALAGVLPDLGSTPSKRVPSGDVTLARPKNGEDHALVDRVLSAVEATRDSRTGLSFVPAIVAKLRPELNAQTAAAILVAVAGDGLLELRPEGGINRLSEEELAMCPPGPQGTRLSWARRTEVQGQ
ncbi:MAG TPA: hypothetical protein VNW92_13985 [Polyangiaceae bacterium]|jgi:hypothetical protein|nr:hypothetical protein [Polyangiaceae bacterium]